MKLYAPAYYKNFKCIADKCEHSCCVGWEIDIDKETLDKYVHTGDNGLSIILSFESYLSYSEELFGGIVIAEHII